MHIVGFDDLSEKEVININDCRKLGYISDVCIDIECGRIISFTVKNCFGFIFGKNDEITIVWENIKKIGDDIILVDICVQQNVQHQLPPPKKRFFS